MNNLSKSQLALLRRCLDPLPFQSLSPADAEVCYFLEQNGYVKFIKGYSDDIYDVHIESVVITEAGKSYLSANEDYEVWRAKKYRLDVFAIVIAGLALLVSVLAYLK